MSKYNTFNATSLKTNNQISIQSQIVNSLINYKILNQQKKNNGGVRPLSFNPPIVWHEGGAIRSDTDIPWEY